MVLQLHHCFLITSFYPQHTANLLQISHSQNIPDFWNHQLPCFLRRQICCLQITCQFRRINLLMKLRCLLLLFFFFRCYQKDSCNHSHTKETQQKHLSTLSSFFLFFQISSSWLSAICFCSHTPVPSTQHHMAVKGKKEPDMMLFTPCPALSFVIQFFHLL